MFVWILYEFINNYYIIFFFLKKAKNLHALISFLKKFFEDRPFKKVFFDNF